MIIEINNIKIVWFENFFNSNTNKIGIHISGGLDSALLFWMLCKFTNDLERYDLQIYPCHARDINHQLRNTTIMTKNIINIVSNQFPKVDIQKLTMGAFCSHIDKRKVVWSKTPENKLRTNHGVDWIIDARNMNFSEEEAIQFGIDINSPPWTLRDDKRDPHRILTGIDTIEDPERISPFYNCNKITIRMLYEKYGLMDTIFPLTCSCIETVKKSPCEECYWCIEKKAAFGVY